MFLLNKIIKNKKIELSAKKIMVMHMVFKSRVRPPKQPMVLLYMVDECLANGFKTMCKASHTTHGFIVDGLGGRCKWF